MFGWLEHRTGIKKLIGLMLLEGVPGGAKWRYVWGSCLAFVFSIQLITGILLMTAYSPSASQAWSSVHTIQYKMDFGWFVRGLHHFGSQTMMVLIGLHMLQVVIAGAHLPPRELNWWTGIGLLSVTLGLSLTGYLLPWDQKGYWATDVATNIAGSLPEMGSEIKQQAVGGADSGNPTLTRFYALHVAVLPLSLIVLLIVHIALFRRQGVTSPENPEGLVTKPENEHKPGTDSFWPRQAFYDMLACMGVFAVMLSLVLYGFAHHVKTPPRPDGEEPSTYETIARAGLHGKGAELDAAADRDTPNYPARPEWYFLFLFQLLKYFPGEQQIFGTVIIPNGVMLVLTLLPVFGYGPLRKFGHFFGILFVVSLLTIVSMLTIKALMDDTTTGLKIPYTAIPTAILIALCWIGPFRRLIGTIGNLIVAVLIVVGGGATVYLFTLPADARAPYSVTLKNTDEKLLEKAEKFEHSREEAEYLAKRACEAAMPGSPVEGGHIMMRNDPYTKGRELFKVQCASCHSFTRQQVDIDNERDWPTMDDVDRTDPKKPKKLVKTASDLGNFGTKDWVLGLLKNPMDDHYFGLVKKPKKDTDDKVVLDEKGKPVMEEGLTGMRAWRKGIDKARQSGKVDAKEQDKDFVKIAELLEYLATPADKRKDDEPENKKLIEAGQNAFFDDVKNKCSTCHSMTQRVKDEKTGKLVWRKEGDETAPDLSGYGSADWLRGMIMRPGHKSRYALRNLMPAFRNRDALDSEILRDEFREASENEKAGNMTMPENMILPLTDVEREMIIRWILRDYRPVFGGSPISK